MTAEELLSIRDDAYRHELIEGILQKLPLRDWKRGAINAFLQMEIGSFVFEKGFGRVFGAGTGFLISRDPDTVRAPDLAFIAADRLPPTFPKDAFWPGVPDLAVEVLSSGDSKRETQQKVASWLDAGTKCVWVIDPKLKSVSVYDQGQVVRSYSNDEVLDGGRILPGFRLTVGAIFTL